MQNTRLGLMLLSAPMIRVTHSPLAVDYEMLLREKYPQKKSNQESGPSQPSHPPARALQKVQAFYIDSSSRMCHLRTPSTPWTFKMMFRTPQAALRRTGAKTLFRRRAIYHRQRHPLLPPREKSTAIFHGGECDASGANANVRVTTSYFGLRPPPNNLLLMWVISERRFAANLRSVPSPQKSLNSRRITFCASYCLQLRPEKTQISDHDLSAITGTFAGNEDQIWVYGKSGDVSPAEIDPFPFRTSITLPREKCSPSTTHIELNKI